MKVAYTNKDDQDQHIVVADQKYKGLDYGCLVSVKAGRVAQMLPVGSIGNHMPDTEWVPFEGDPAPILALVEKAASEGRLDPTGTLPPSLLE